MKSSFLLLICLVLISCNQDKNKRVPKEISSEKANDTLLVKHQNELSLPFSAKFRSKSFSYHWIAKKDTLDFALHVNENKKDSTLDVSFTHEKPILFSKLIQLTSQCLPIIEDDFQLSKMKSFYFKSPIFYLDITKQLSKEYEQKFGRKKINYQKKDEFLMNSSLTKEINNFLEPLNLCVKSYFIEKFHLIEEDTYPFYLKNIDLTEYPDFAIHGGGIYVQLEER